MSSTSAPYTNNAGVVFPYMGSGNPLATQAYADAADAVSAAAVTAAAYEAVAHTATVAGATTGTITSSAHDLFVTVTSGNSAHIIILPAPTPGRIVRLLVGANGYELKSSDPATVAINGGTGAAVSSTVATTVYVVAQCVSATAWRANTYSSIGTEAALEAAH